MADIIHRIGIKAPLANVYKAFSSIEGLANWWTSETSGDSSVKGKIEFVFRTLTGEVVGKMIFEVLALTPDKNARWQCVEGPPDWIGTELTFDISYQDNQTILLFGHRKWAEASESMAHCSMKWATFMLSLREYVETGKGKPSPNDLKIDNWN